MAVSWRAAGAGVLFLLLIGSPAGAQSTVVPDSTDPAWLEPLAAQLATQEQCKVVEYIEIRENIIGGRKTNFAKVRCEDGRLFDASRIGPAQEFDIRMCQIQAC